MDLGRGKRVQDWFRACGGEVHARVSRAEMMREVRGRGVGKILLPQLMRAMLSQGQELVMKKKGGN